MLTVAAGAVVLLFAAFLVGLAGAAFLAPKLAARFLGGFASSLKAHVTEQVLRLIAGGALVLYAPGMLFPRAFQVLGWLLVVTAAGLLLVPWRLHNRFASWVVPLAIRRLRLQGAGALLLGLAVAWAVAAGPGALGWLAR